MSVTGRSCRPTSGADGVSEPRSSLGRFLLAIIDGGGTVPPALGLARALISRGHQVRVLADPTVAADAESAGCTFSPWRAAPHFRSRDEQTAVIAAFESRRPHRAFKALRDFAGPGMTSRYAQDVVSTAQEAGVDAILAEGALPGIVIGAQCTGLPTAALMANIYLRPTKGFPLMGTGWSPARGLPGRVRDWLAPTAARWLLDRTLPRINAVLAEYGRSPLTELFEVFDRCDRVLVMTSPAFDFAVPQLPGNVRYVGPQLDDPDWAARIPWQRQGTEPLVLGATSSIYQHQTDLLRRIARALGSLPVRGVVTTGRAIDPRAIAAAANVEVLQAAPHRRVLAEASVVITHAGHGTVLRTLAAGVPLVCMPMGRDQKDNTVRVLRLGAGVRINEGSTPVQIAAAVAELLNDERYTAAARRFSQVLASEAADRPSAVDEAEALLHRRKSA